MPILVRPVREQLEHDRIIRLLEAKWKRKFKVDANPGDERNAGIKVATGTIFPDLVLTEEGGRKPKALIEVETSESVNHLEARAQWAHLAKSRTSLLLFVPAGAVESARRLADENSIKVSELWTYLVLGDQVRFTSVFRENGLEPADLVEKAEMFTTERPAPAPRPVVVEPPAPEPAAVAPVPERPRKLAVKVASKAVTEVTARSLPKPGLKVAPPAPPKPVVALAPARPVKVDAVPVTPAAPARPAVKGAAAPKPIEKPAPDKLALKKTAERVAAPLKPAPERTAPEKVAAKPAPAKLAPPVKAAPPSKVAATAKAAAPAKVVATKAVPKPAVKVAAKAGKPPALKPVVTKAVAKAAAKPAMKKAAAPAKLAKTAKRK